MKTLLNGYLAYIYNCKSHLYQIMKTLLNGYLAYIYNCKSHLYQVIYNWLLKSRIIYTKIILLR